MFNTQNASISAYGDNSFFMRNITSRLGSNDSAAD